MVLLYRELVAGMMGVRLNAKRFFRRLLQLSTEETKLVKMERKLEFAKYLQLLNTE